MTWWEGLVLGLVQGLTEFLPVSSSGHLVVAEGLLGLRSPGVAVEVTLHLATLLAVVIVYRAALTRLAGGLWRRESDASAQVIFLVAASLPAAVIGLVFQDALTAASGSFLLVGVNFLVTGLLLASTRWIRPRPDRTITLGTALLVGLAQAVAILPGISRSGTTIAAALWRGVPAWRAAEFSFLMAVVVIAGSGVLEARHLAALPLTAGLGTAFLSALVSGVIAIRFLLWLLRAGVFTTSRPTSSWWVDSPSSGSAGRELRFSAWDGAPRLHDDIDPGPGPCPGGPGGAAGMDGGGGRADGWARIPGTDVARAGGGSLGQRGAATGGGRRRDGAQSAGGSCRGRDP